MGLTESHPGSYLGSHPGRSIILGGIPARIASLITISHSDWLMKRVNERELRVENEAK